MGHYFQNSTSVTAAITVTCAPGAGPASQLAFGNQPPASTAANVAFATPPTVRILDASGNLTSSTATVTLALGANPGSGVLSGTTQVQAVNGVATFNGLSINKVGTGYTLTATSSPSYTAATSNTFNITPGAATQLTVSAPAAATAGTPFNVTVTALDAAGNTATGYSGTVHFTSTDGSATLPSDGVLTNGTGTFSARLATAGSQTITARDTVTSSIAGTSGTVNVTVGPSVTSISPSVGQAGTTAPSSIVISGANFGAAAANNTVTFGGSVGTVLGANASVINVTPPANSTAGAVDVVVTNTTTGQSTTVVNGYRYLTPASLTGATLSRTSFTNGDPNGATLTFTLQNTNAVPLGFVDILVPNNNITRTNAATTCSGGTAGVSGSSITLSTLPANTTCTLSFKILPANSSTRSLVALTGNISSNTANSQSLYMPGNSRSAPPLTILQAVPTVTQVSPASGSTAGSTPVTITGTNFDSVAATGAVTFGGQVATYTVVSPTSITASAPAHVAGQVDVLVTNEGGTSAVAATDKFTYVAPPAVTSPAAGSTVASPTPTYTGTASAGSTVELFVDGASIGNASVSGTNWTLAQPSPLAASASHQVYAAATLNGVTLNSATITFASKASQTITLVSSPPSAAQVYSGSYAPTATASSGLAVDFTIDASAASICSRVGNIVQYDAVGTCVIDFDQSGDASTYAAPRLQQSFVISAAGQTLTFGAAPSNPVVGGSYTPSATSTRTFDGAATGLTASYSIDAGSTSGACTLSGGTVSFTGPGTCTVNADQAGDGTHYAAATRVQQSFSIGLAPPTIASVSPANGTSAGGTSVTIQGSNFDTVLSGNAVTFGGTPATVTGGSATSLTVTTQQRAAGTVDVVVTTSGGTASATGAYTFIDPPAVPTITATPPSLSGTASATFTFTLNGGTAQCALDAGGFTACTSPQTYTGLADGPHSFQVRATNSVGTSAAASYSWTVDTTVPAAPVIATPANNAFVPLGTLTVSGTAEAGATVTLSLDGSLNGTATATGGSWTLTTSTPLNAGTHTLQATTTDASGNVSPASNLVTVTAAAPPSTTVAQGNVTATTGAPLSITPVTASGGAGNPSFSVSPSLPAGLTLNTSTGTITGTPTATAPATAYTITVTDQAGQTSSASFTLAVDPEPTPTLTFAVPGPARLVAGGGLNNPASSSIPSGGAISYTSSNPGVASVNGSGAVTALTAGTTTITATQAASTGVNSQASASYTLTVDAELQTVQAIASATLSQDVLATAFRPVTASGGVGSYSYSLSAPLPSGLNFDTGTGEISGTPTVASPATPYTVTVTDQTPGTPQSSSKSFQLTVNATPTPTLTFATPGSAGVVMGNVLTNTATSSIPGGGSISYASSNTGVASVNPSTGAITTASAGTTTITATQAASAGVNNQATQSYTLTVYPALSVTQAIPSVTLTANVGVSPAVRPVAGSGGVGTLTYTLSAPLPAGLSFDTGTGEISGTPTAVSGSTTYTVSVTDQTPGGAQSGSQSFQLTVAAEPVPVLTFAAPGSAGVVLGNAFANAATSSVPGGGAITYSSSNGAVATVNASGAVTTIGSGTTVITATQAASPGVNSQATQSYTLTVYPVLTASQAIPSTTLVRTQPATPFTPVTASGGVAPRSFAVSPGLPSGLSLDSTTGEISGTPQVALATTSFTVTVTDQTPVGAQSASQVFTLTITGAPNVADKTVAVPYDTATPIDLSASITGAAHTSIAVASGPSHGTTSVSGDTVTYTPTAGYYGPDSFTYTATGPGGTSTAATVSLIVATPAAPVAADRNGVTVPYASSGIAIDLSGSISGVRSSIAIASSPAHGSVAVSGEVVTYTPNATHYGPDSFTYTATGPGGTSTPATVSLSVANPPAPVATSPAAVAVPYEGTGTVIDLSGAITGAHSSIAIATPPQHGAATVAGDQVTYVPAAGYYGADSFTYTATGPGGTSAPATVSLTIATPAAPTAAARSMQVPYNGTGTAIDLSPAITGVHSGVTIATAPAHGTVSVAGDVVTYTPTAGYYGADSFTYVANGPGGASPAATVTLGVDNPPAPVAADRSGVAVAYGSSGTAIDLSGSVTGVHSAITVATQPTHGAVTVAGDVVTYVPAAGYFGVDSFTYTATGPGGTSAPATVSLSVAIPPAPAAADKSGVTIAYNSSGTAIDLSPSVSGVHTALAIATAPAHGTVTVSGDVVTYVPTPNYYGADSFTYTATGPGGTSAPATVRLTVATPPPPVTEPGASTVASRSTTTQGSSTSIDLSSLVDGVYDTIRIETPPQHGTVVLQGGSSARTVRGGVAAPDSPVVAVYTPAPGFAGTDSFTFVAVGPGGTSAPATVTITVLGQVPVAQPKTAQAGDGQMVSVMLTDGAAQGPFTAANVVGVTPAGSATTAIVASGSGYRLDVTPNNRFGGTIVVSYTLSNAFGTSLPATVTVTVAARPDPRQDPNVRAISDAQVEAARRFGRAQVANFMRRAEQLHGGGGSTGVAMGVTLASRDQSMVRQRPDAGNWDRALTDRMHFSGEDPALGRTANASPLARGGVAGVPNAAPAAEGTYPAAAAEADGSGGRRIGSVASWVGGSIDIGTRDRTTDRAKISATTAGLSAGADVKLADGVLLGIGGGYGNDLSRIGTVARVRGKSTLYAAYASVQPGGSLFLDGMIGRGDLDFTTRRLVSAVNADALGSRDGDYTLGALSLGIDQAGSGALSWSLYGRGEYLGADLGSYAETGAGRYNLRFDARELRSITGTLGGRLEYRQAFGFGTVTPRLRAEWNHEFADVDAQLLDYADIPGTALYALDSTGWKREQLQLSLGTRFDILRGNWSFDFETGLRAGTGEKAGTLQIRVSKEF
jgi:large repetitive protein